MHTRCSSAYCRAAAAFAPLLTRGDGAATQRHGRIVQLERRKASVKVGRLVHYIQEVHCKSTLLTGPTDCRLLALAGKEVTVGPPVGVEIHAQVLHDVRVVHGTQQVDLQLNVGQLLAVCTVLLHTGKSDEAHRV